MKKPDDRYPLIQLLGDKIQGARWVSWAKQKLRSMKELDTIPLQSNDRVEQGTVLIHVATLETYDLIRITASGGASIYMESGRFDPKSFWYLDEAAYLPGTLDFSSALAAYQETTKKPQCLKLTVSRERCGQGQAETQDMDSKVAFCPHADDLVSFLTACVPLPDGGVGACEDFGSLEGPQQYCQAAQNLKAAQSLTPPGLYAGKLKQWVSAVYGSKRNDYGIDTSSGLYHMSALTIAGQALGWSVPTSILLTTSDYRYVLCNAGIGGDTGQVTAVELVPSAAGSVLRSRLRADCPEDDDARRRIESYILSTCVPATDSDHAINVLGAMEDYSVYGAPMYYGWKPNWNGHEARIVLVRVKEDSWGEDYRLQSTILKLTMSLDDRNLSVHVGIEQPPTDFIPRDEDQLWQPVPSFYDHEPVSWHPPGMLPLPVPPENQDIAVYGWYDSKDVWQTLNYVYSRTSEETYYPTYVGEYPCSADGKWCQASSYTDHAHVVAGWRAADVLHTAKTGGETGRNVITDFYENIGVQPPECPNNWGIYVLYTCTGERIDNSNFCESKDYGNCPTWFQGLNGDCVRNGLNIGSGGSTLVGRAATIIPLDASEGAYVGVFSVRDTENLSWYVLRNNRPLVWTGVAPYFWSQEHPPCTGCTGLSICPNEYELSKATYGNVWIGGVAVSPESSGGPVQVIWSSITCTLVTPHTSVSLEGQRTGNSEDAATLHACELFDEWNSYYDPGAEDGVNYFGWAQVFFPATDISGYKHIGTSFFSRESVAGHGLWATKHPIRAGDEQKDYQLLNGYTEIIDPCAFIGHD
jgi:hypothetical protein